MILVIIFIFGWFEKVALKKWLKCSNQNQSRVGGCPILQQNEILFFHLYGGLHDMNIVVYMSEAPVVML